MEITFEIKETLREILEELQNSESWEWQLDTNENLGNGEHGSIIDWDHNDSAAKISWWRYGNSVETITIETAWSKFSYRINYHHAEDKVYCVYNGAYNGFLQQWLLPTLTPINLLDADVKSSISNATKLRNFLIDREIFLTFKESVGVGNNGSPRQPKVIWNALKEDVNLPEDMVPKPEWAVYTAEETLAELKTMEEEEGFEIVPTRKFELPDGRIVWEDDLKLIKGIGPKIEGILHNEYGIFTWKELGETSVALLECILYAAGPAYRMRNPSTWPRQARLASQQRWERLLELQEKD